MYVVLVSCSYTNHERSKKHRENVALLKVMMEEEERESCSPSGDDVLTHGAVAQGELPSSDLEVEHPGLSSSRVEGGEEAGVSVAGLRLDEDEEDGTSNDEELALSSLVRYISVKLVSPAINDYVL